MKANETIERRMPARPLALFGVCVQIGLLSFGGSLTGWVHREVVARRAWMTEQEFLSGVALGQILPGTNISNLMVYIGQRLHGVLERVVEVQRLWKDIYNLPDAFAPDGSQWDRLFVDGDRFAIGNLEAQALSSPGHTLASVTYVVGDAAFVHDTLLMPDYGTARCDFPGGDARQLWRTLQRILSLPDDTRLFTGHDYMPGGRAPARAP